MQFNIIKHVAGISTCFLFLFFLVSPAWSIDFTPEEQAFITKAYTIRVHNETDWPPFNFNENSTPQGISIDVMNRVAEATGLNVQYVTGPSWGQFMRMVEKDQLEVMLNIVDLEERRDIFQFTTPYAKSLSGIFTTNKKQGDFSSFDDLNGKTLAVPEGFDLEIKLNKYHPNVKLLPVRDILACIEAIQEGKADAFMEEIGVVDYIMSQQMVSNLRLAFPVNDEAFISNLNIGVKKSDHILFAVIQKGLNSISADELNRIRKKWLLKVHEIYEQNMVSLSVPEKEFLYQNNTVQICVDPSWPPLDFIDENGDHNGLSADLIGKIATRIGVKLELVPTTTWQQTLEFIQDGKCKIIPLMNATNSAASYIDFTQPYFNFTTVIATRNDASFIGDYTELYGKKVALQSYFFITEYVREHHPQIEIIEVENTIEALKMVSEQKAFATIDGLPTVVNTIESLALENIKIVGSVPQENQMKIGVSKGNDLLLSILSKGISSLTEKEKIGLYKKWFDIEVSNQIFNRSLIVKCAIGLLIVLVFLLWRQFTLSKYTHQLKALNEKLRYSSTVDHLTKIFNRRSIENHFTTEVKRAKLTKSELSVVILDIDHFKKVNDSFGHIAGDSVLETLATLVTSSIRKSDRFGRWGGEEFLIVLPETNGTDAKIMINKLKEKISQYDFKIDRPLTASFGIGQYKFGEDPTSLLTRVDQYLYAAKDKGRNTVITETTFEGTRNF